MSRWKRFGSGWSFVSPARTERAAALGRRSWSGVLRFAEHTDALAQGWDAVKIREAMVKALEAHESAEVNVELYSVAYRVVTLSRDRTAPRPPDPAGKTTSTRGVLD